MLYFFKDIDKCKTKDTSILFDKFNINTGDIHSLGLNNKLLNKIGFQLIKQYPSPEIIAKETHTAINKPKLIIIDEKGKLYQCNYYLNLRCLMISLKIHHLVKPD